MTRMSPVVAAFVATATAGLLCGLVGVAAGRWWERRTCANDHDLLPVLERRLARAERAHEADLDAIAELRAGVSDMWDRAFKAGRTTDEWTLVAAEVQRRQRERGGGRS